MPLTNNDTVIRYGGLAWRLLLYFTILIVSFMLLSKGYRWVMDTLGIHWASGPDAKPAEAVLFGQVRLLLAALLAWRITARVGRDDQRPILPLRKRSASHFVQGSLWGLAAMATTIALIAVCGGYHIDGLALSGTALAYYVVLWVAIGVVNGLAENMALLGYPLFRTADAAGWPPAMVIMSALFAFAHMANPGESPIGILSVFVTVLAMAVAVFTTGDLWLSAGIHAGIILAEDLIFSLPDSGQDYTGHLFRSRIEGPAWVTGGAGGPEATFFALAVFMGLLVIIRRVYRDAAS